MIPFQCDTCQFINLNRRLPGNQDQLLMAYIRRVTLDAFWSREPTTVRANLNSLRRVYRTTTKLGMSRLFPPMGPFPIGDVHGMGPAIAMLDKSLDPGRHTATVQWATARKIRSAITNVYQASVGGLKDSVGAYEAQNLWTSSAVTRSFFFNRFANGMHRRMGEVVKPDEPISIHVLQLVLKLLKKERAALIRDKNPGWEDRVFDIDQTGAWFVIGFCASLRGEEMLLIELAGTLESLTRLSNPPDGMVPHFRVVISGPTKNNRLTGNKFTLPIAAVTEKGHIQAGFWIACYAASLKRIGRKDGPLFKRNKKYPKLSEFEDNFYHALEMARAEKEGLFPTNIDIREIFYLSRSLRRGSVAHATNCKVPSYLIDAINRWRVHRANDNPSLSMRSHYARLDLLLETLLEYSRQM